MKSHQTCDSQNLRRLAGSNSQGQLPRPEHKQGLIHRCGKRLHIKTSRKDLQKQYDSAKVLTYVQISEIPRRGRSRGGCCAGRKASTPNLRKITGISFRTSHEGCEQLSQICHRFESQFRTSLCNYPSDFLFPLQPPPPPRQTPRPSHAREPDFGQFPVHLGPFRLRLGPFPVGSVSGLFRGVGWGRGGVRERGFCKGKESFSNARCWKFPEIKDQGSPKG